MPPACATEAREYSEAAFRQEAAEYLRAISRLRGIGSVRRRLYEMASASQFHSTHCEGKRHGFIFIRDCARAVRGMVSARSDKLAGFSVSRALWDIARKRARPDLSPAFFAEMTHLFRGLQGRAEPNRIGPDRIDGGASARAGAIARSDELDALWADVQSRMDRYPDGLTEEAIARRAANRERILSVLGGAETDWDDWEWQIRNVIVDPEELARAVPLRDDEFENARRARLAGLPFGVTPYYASLMDATPGSASDRAVRAQVLPPADYVAAMEARRHLDKRALDFMREEDTSPVNLVTRRYPAIAILKPFNACPQACVYCQRNWEIDEVMAPGALARWEDIEAACDWIAAHPAIREVLVTGGDPLALPDESLERVLSRVAGIPNVDLIRIGSRIPATMPMRVTARLTEVLGGLRVPGHREVCLVTHVEHPYEITPDLVAAIERLRRQGISVYNQLVYTFYVSRRFEAAQLRMVLRRAGIDPYYTFVPKGKDETRSYRVPIARILQEQKEEARLLPGTRRTDEPVYNLPGLGKNYLRAVQHRDVISVLPNGARVYEFHPWEKNIVRRGSYVGTDVPILEYLQRLAGIGEDVSEYASVWYYF